MRLVRMLFVGVLLTAALGSTLWAEKVDTPPKGLRRTATHVVTGEVVAIYTRAATKGDWAYTHYLAEVKVAKVEKGEGLTSGGLVYVRYWRRKFTGAVPPPSTGGHRGLPKEGQSLRIYLARNAYDGFTKENHDGGFNVIGANGFEKLAAKTSGGTPK